jgi:hypothetical protein
VRPASRLDRACVFLISKPQRARANENASALVAVVEKGFSLSRRGGGGGGGCLPRSPGHSYTLLTRNTTSTFKVRCHRHIPPAVFPRPVRARTVACRSPVVWCRIFFERFERQLCHTAVYQTAAFCGRPLHSSSPRFRGDSHVLFERVSRRAARGRATFPARAALETQGRAASSTAREGWHRFRISLRGTSR